jgi:branched-chain amino acid transport system ATP-binding protein
MAPVTLLSTEKLSRNFGGLRAVSNVDFELTEGHVHALIGPNGAGKTTFVGLICGRIPASAGRVRFLGEDISHLPAHERIGRGMAYTFQITSVFAGLSVRENVVLAVRRRMHANDRLVERAVEEALIRVGLASQMEKMAGDLSYGHQRLLEIAMGIGQKPRLLILDEPTQGLSDAEIEDFKELIRSIAGGTTVLLIEHNMDVVMETADLITVMDAGTILAEGAPEAIRSNVEVQHAYLGTA